MKISLLKICAVWAIAALIIILALTMFGVGAEHWPQSIKHQDIF